MKQKAVQGTKLQKLFRQDQLQALSRKSMSGVQWSAVTVRKALQLGFACGASGYQLLLQQSYPLPSVRTLQRRLKTVSFRPGILDQVFIYLQLKVKQPCEEEQVCFLTLDETSISPCVEYDPSSGQLLGYVSLEDHSGVATHALVIMLGGVTSRWKQTVAYYFTGNSSDGTVLKPLVLEIIEKAAGIGLYVIAVTSDMGSMNRAMWRSFGLRTGRHCATVNKIPHPLDSQKIFAFSFRCSTCDQKFEGCLANGNVFTLPESMVSEHNLSSCNVSIAPCCVTVFVDAC